MFKSISILFAIVAVVIAAALFYATTIITTTIEKIGTEAVGAPVTLDSISLGLVSGELSIAKFSVANPKGFEAAEALSFGEIFVNVDIASLLSDKIHVEEVRISAPAIFYEGLLKKNNFKVIQNNVNNFVGSSATPSNTAKSTETSTEASSDKSAKKIQLDLFVIEEAEMSLVMTTPLGAQKAKVKLPEIMIKDIGKDAGGATIAEVVSKVSAPLLKNVTAASVGAFSNLDDLKKDAEKNLRGRVNEVKEKALGKLNGLFGG